MREVLTKLGKSLCEFHTLYYFYHLSYLYFTFLYKRIINIAGREFHIQGVYLVQSLENQAFGFPRITHELHINSTKITHFTHTLHTGQTYPLSESLYFLSFPEG